MAFSNLSHILTRFVTQTSNDSTIPWEGGAYSIKRHGVSILNCDSEPVQTPGCIQAHGALLVLRLSDLTILQASENTLEHLEIAPEDLLGKSVATVVGPHRETMLRVFLAREPVDLNPLYLFTCAPRADAGPLDVFIHTIDGLAVLEFEATGRGEGKIDPDYYALVKQSVARLQAAQTLNDFCRIVTEEVRALTALDRVMVYRFHEDFHGEVVAESKREDLSGWLGLHYPAEDIPQPAREIFKKLWIRPLPDANAPVVEMVPLVNSDTGKPLNMTYCCLRGASVMHTEYLQNMGVAASLTMAIHRDGELWGLVACHHYKPTHFPHQVRAGCEFLAQVASLQLRAAEQRENLGYRLQLEGVHNQLIAKATQDVGLKSITEGSPNLQDGMNAGGAALYHAKRWWRMGPTPTEAQLDALKIWLVTRPHFQEPNRQLYATNSLVRDYPDAAAFADVASGLLAVSIGPRHESLILWFRPEIMQTVKWAGNPDEKPIVTGPHGPRLTPRKSFEIFTESVRHCALPWKTVELEAALRLRLLIIELVVTRAEQLAQMNADLTRSNEELDAFAYVASHDLKEPLRGIFKYAHQLLEGAASLDEENRKRLQGLMRLTLRMDSLLDSLLHFSRVGRASLDLQTVDLNEVVEEALEIVDARRQETPTDIVLPRRLPIISCDRMRVREVFANLLGNALKYNDQPRRCLEINFLAPGEAGEANAPRECLAETIFYVRDNGIGIERRHFDTIFQLFKRLHGRDEYGGGSGAGLTIVQKLVAQHQGRVWLSSTVGIGSTFYFTLSCSEQTPK